MLLRQVRRSGLRSSIGLLGVLCCLGPAQAATIILPLGAAEPLWQLEYASTQVTAVNWDNANKEITLTKTYTSIAPITLTFTQHAASASDNTGLRGVTLSVETIVNSSGQPWPGFTMKLEDPNPVLPGAHPNVTAGHPGFAHTHPDFAYTAPPFTLTSGGDQRDNAAFGSGIFADGATKAWTGFSIHQVEAIGKTRSFTLVQTPIPEPSTALLLGAGLAALAVRRRRTVA